MLQQKYLPHWHFRSAESILVNASIPDVYPLVLKLDFSASKIIYRLFKLRGLPVPSSLCMDGLQRLRFRVLEEVPGKSFIVGIIGKFWTLTGSLRTFDEQGFIAFDNKAYAKATWSFDLQPISEHQTLIQTQTRVFCAGKTARLKFQLYWFFICPFSSLIRRQILRCLKRQAEEKAVTRLYLKH